MKKILLTSFIALTVCGAHSQWTNQNLPSITYDSFINDIEVVDANVVWGNNQNGTATSQYTKSFVRTVDGGNTWTLGSIVGSPAANLIANIWPVSADTCYVSMYGTTAAASGVFKTTNGGANWTEVGTNMFTAATSFPDVVYFWNSQNGFAMGDPAGTPLKYELYLTNDAGATWTQVPGANIPVLTNTAEFGITNLFAAADGYLWFATTYGDVYRSIDGGNNWTKSATGFPPYNTGTQEQDISDITFTDSLNGLALQINATGYLLKSTADGGLTWTDVFPAGPFFLSDMDAMPDTNIFVSAGSSASGFGTSYSNDNGATWALIDTSISHTGIDFANSSTGWSGEFIAAGSAAGGAYKFDGFPQTISCGSTSINPGNMTVNSHIICFNDTLIVTTTGVVAPTDGATHGFSVIVSSADISGNNDPLSDPSILGGTGVIIGNPPPTVLINDASIFPAGIYFFTPVVYGNATGSGNITALTLDPNCTNTGTSQQVDLRVQGDPTCQTGITEQSSNNLFGIKNIYPVPAKDHINVTFNSKENGTVTMSVKDIMGKEILSSQFSAVKGENNMMLDVSNHSAGIYFLTVTGNESIVVSKFVKE
ncbi:MAG: T9SS type A sorting domain-containing protein [Bacteroidia bacterium]